MRKIDQIDRQILRQLQKNADMSLENLAGQLSLSTNACWRRVKKLEEDGIIARRIAIVPPEKVGKGMTVFVAVKTSNHSAEWLTKFASAANHIDEIVELYRMAGDIDYLMKILVSDVGDYDRVYKKLIASVELSDVTASFAMEKVKFDLAVPL